jgi:hypothetical protein
MQCAMRCVTRLIRIFIDYVCRPVTVVFSGNGAKVTPAVRRSAPFVR